jgi:hypothetical protein
MRKMTVQPWTRQVCGLRGRILDPHSTFSKNRDRLLDANHARFICRHINGFAETSAMTCRYGPLIGSAQFYGLGWRDRLYN